MDDRNLSTPTPVVATTLFKDIMDGTLLKNVTNLLTNNETESFQTYTEISDEQTWTSPIALISTTKPTKLHTSTTQLYDEFGPPEGLDYIFVPLGVLVFVIILSSVVLIISRKRKLEHLRHRLMPMYNFDPREEEEDSWETELLDENYGRYQRRQGYQSMDSDENAQLLREP